MMAAVRVCERCGSRGFIASEDDYYCLACGRHYASIPAAPPLGGPPMALGNHAYPRGSGRDPNKHYWQKPKSGGRCSVCDEWHYRVFLAMPPGGTGVVQVCNRHEQKWATERE